MQATYDRMRGGTMPMLDVKERAIIEKIVSKDGLKFALAVWLTIRLVLIGWGFVVSLLAPPESHQHVLRDYPDVVLPSHDFYGYTFGVWNVYDTRHYIKIAEEGYASDPDYLTAFFPGFPLLVKAVNLFPPGDSLISALLVANISALIFFWYLYRLVEADYGAEVAKRAVVLSAVFPTSFFLFLAYTEAPLLAFTVASLYYGRQSKWWLAGLLGGAAALTKQPGIFLFVPLAYMYWRQNLSFKKHKVLALLHRFDWLWLLAVPLAAFGYLVYRYFFIGSTPDGATDLGADEMLTFPGVPLLNALLAVRPDNPLLTLNVMEIGFTILMIGLAAGAILKIRSITYSLYSFCLMIVSLSVTWPHVWRPEADMPRRALIIFPIFIYLALVTSNRRVYRYVVYTSSALFLCLSGLFANWVFIS